MNKFLLILSFFCVSTIKANTQPQEIRLGILRHNVKAGSRQSIEKYYDVNIEYLLKSTETSFWQTIYKPRVHIGALINTGPGTNQYYIGLTWHIPLIQSTFIELSFGGEVHDGHRKKATNHKKALGSRLLFRESVSLGLILNNYSISILLNHASNARIAPPNPGITDIGFRLGHYF